MSTHSIWLAILALVLFAPSSWAQTVPVADAGADIIEECTDEDDTRVILDGSGSTDADGDALEYRWTGPAIARQQPVEGVNPQVSLPLGVHLIILTVTDNLDGMDSDTVEVTIEDTTPPDFEVSEDPRELWPPNHKYERVSIRRFIDSVSDDCDVDLDEDDVVIDRAASDEPENSTGDGNTEDDIVLVDDCRALELRAERRGSSNGRVYTAELIVSDSSGNESREEIEVANVPKSRSKPAQEDAVAYVVDGPCESDLDVCPVDPDPGCDGVVGNGKTRLKMRSRDGGSREDIRWEIKGVDSSLADFGDPTDDTDYQLCIYTEENGDADLVSHPGARAGSGWRERRDGFKFRDRGKRSGDGLERVELRARDGARGKVAARGRGGDLDLPDLPIPDDEDVRVQLHNSEGRCWDTLFTDPRRNTEDRYDARE